MAAGALSVETTSFIFLPFHLLLKLAHSIPESAWMRQGDDIRLPDGNQDLHVISRLPDGDQDLHVISRLPDGDQDLIDHAAEYLQTSRFVDEILN